MERKTTLCLVYLHINWSEGQKYVTAFNVLYTQENEEIISNICQTNFAMRIHNSSTSETNNYIIYDQMK